MITKELVDFIKKSKGEGHSNDAIKDVLVKNGWLASDVEEGFKQLVTPLPAPIPVTPTPVAPALAPQTPNIPMQPVSAAQPAPAPAMPHLQNVGMNMPHVGVGIPNMQTRPSVVTPNLNQMPNQMPPMQRTAAVSVMPKRRGLSPVLIIVILLLFAGGASGYYFRDSLKTLPVVKTFFPAEQTTAPIVPPEENPVAPVGNDLKNDLNQDIEPLAPQSSLPALVEAKRQAIYLAAMAQDYEKLVAEADISVRSSKNFTEGPIAGFVRFLNGGVDEAAKKTAYEIIPLLLKTSYAVENYPNTPRTYVWPSVAVKPVGGTTQLTDQELAQLKTFMTDQEIESTKKFGYYSFRLKITSDGKWTAFVSGD